MLTIIREKENSNHRRFHSHLFHHLKYHRDRERCWGTWRQLSPRAQLGGLPSAVSTQKVARQLTMPSTLLMNPPAVLLLRTLPGRKGCLYKDLCTNSHSNFIRNSQKLETNKLLMGSGWRSGGLFMRLESAQEVTRKGPLTHWTWGWLSTVCGRS